MGELARTVIHLDMNAYFAAVEQKSNPILRGKPVLVVADSRRRSVVMTASYEARPYGVKTGMNLYEARKLCPHAYVIDGNADKYLDSTGKILEALESFTDQVEMASCDEAYLDVTGSLKCFRTDSRGLGERIRARIKGLSGLPCSIGVAPNKLLAKLASEMQKPDGLTVIEPEDVEAVMARTLIDELCGVGTRLKVQMNEMGIKTCKDLGEAPIGKLHNRFGFWAYHLKRMGQGKDGSPVRRLDEEEEEKSVGHSTTFPNDTSNPDILKSYLLLLCEKVAFRLRRRGFEGRTVSLTVRYKDFTTFSREHKTGTCMNDGYEIYGAALAIMEKTPLTQAVRLLGVSVSALVPSQRQEFLFEAMGRRRRMDKTADEINRKFGSFTLKPASLLHAERHGILQAPIPPAIAARRVYG